MNRQFKTAVTLTALTVLTATTTLSQAWAVDANAFTERLQTNMKASGWELSSSKSEADGNDIVLHDASLAPLIPNSKEPAKATKVGDLRFTNVSEDKDGNYKAEDLKIPAISVEDNGIGIQVKNIEVTNMNIASDKATDPMVKFVPFESITIDESSFSKGSDTFLTFNGLNLAYKAQSNGQSIEISSAIKSFDYEPEKSGDPSTVAKLKELGFSNVQGSMDVHGSWDLKDGKYDMDKFVVDVKDAGKLNLSFNLGGMTAELLQNISTLRNNAISGKADEKTAAAGLMGVAQQVSFGSMKIRYDDASFAGKLLDMGAKQNGMKKGDLVQQIKAMMPAMGAQINHPEFVKNTTEQVGKFLDNPKSLTISAAPKQAVPFTILVATAGASPAQLIDLINLKVEANN